MTSNLKNLDRLPQTMLDPIQRYVELLSQLDADNISSLTFYGSIVAGNFDPKTHVARNVLVVNDVNIWKLYHLAEQGITLGKTGIRAPLIMSPQYISASLDTFPLEFMEIQQMHATVLGEDPFNDLSFAEADMRLQCEREFKTILLQMRQGLLAAAGREGPLAELETQVLEAVVRTCRGLLWLEGVREPKPVDQVITEAERIAKQELPGVRKVVNAPDQRNWEAFRRLYEDVEKLGAVVDAWT